MLSNSDLPLAQFPIDNGWKIINSSYNGKKMIARINAAAKPFAGHIMLPFRAGIAVPLLQADSNGFPSKNEIELLNAIEDSLCANLQPELQGFLVAIITTNAMREFLFYVQSAAGLMNAKRAASTVAQGYKLQHYVSEDKSWNGYRQLFS